MKKLHFEFIGGPYDGQNLDGPMAQIYYANSQQGKIVTRFWVASEHVQGEGHFGVPLDKPFQRHIYEISERIEEKTEVLVRARYVGVPESKVAD